MCNEPNQTKSSNKNENENLRPPVKVKSSVDRVTLEEAANNISKGNK